MPWWTPKPDRTPDPAETKFGPEAFALTCLALELAKSDESLDAVERARLASDLAHHFDLSPSDVDELMAAGEAHQAQSVQTYGYTKALRDTLDEDQRVTVIETLWRLAFADGVLDAQEYAFMRTVPAALGVENHLSEAAKRRARAALS